MYVHTNLWHFSLPKFITVWEKCVNLQNKNPGSQKTLHFCFTPIPVRQHCMLQNLGLRCPLLPLRHKGFQPCTGTCSIILQKRRLEVSVWLLHLFPWSHFCSCCLTRVLPATITDLTGWMKPGDMKVPLSLSHQLAAGLALQASHGNSNCKRIHLNYARFKAGSWRLLSLFLTFSKTNIVFFQKNSEKFDFILISALYNN